MSRILWVHRKHRDRRRNSRPSNVLWLRSLRLPHSAVRTPPLCQWCHLPARRGVRCGLQVSLSGRLHRHAPRARPYSDHPPYPGSPAAPLITQPTPQSPSPPPNHPAHPARDHLPYPQSPSPPPNHPAHPAHDLLSYPHTPTTTRSPTLQ